MKAAWTSCILRVLGARLFCTSCRTRGSHSSQRRFEFILLCKSLFALWCSHILRITSLLRFAWEVHTIGSPGKSLRTWHSSERCRYLWHHLSCNISSSNMQLPPLMGIFVGSLHRTCFGNSLFSRLSLSPFQSCLVSCMLLCSQKDPWLCLLPFLPRCNGAFRCTFRFRYLSLRSNCAW